MGRSPFEVVYVLNHFSPLDLAPLPATNYFIGDVVHRADHIKKLDEQVRLKREKQNEKFKKQVNKFRRSAAFKEGDLVWIHLRKESYHGGRPGKLS